MIFTRGEITNAPALLPLELVADDLVYEHEKTIKHRFRLMF
jgi:hypothetical protein